MRLIRRVVVVLICLSVLCGLYINTECEAGERALSENETASFDTLLQAVYSPLSEYVLDKAHVDHSVNPGQIETLSFTRAKDRREFLRRRSIFEKKTYSSLDFFRVKTSKAKASYSGEFGDYQPSFENMNFYKVGKNKYRIDFTCCFEDMCENRMDALADVSVYLKKNKKSPLGYKLTKIVFTYR